jgi:hypothetical protein
MYSLLGTEIPYMIFLSKFERMTNIFMYETVRGNVGIEAYQAH